MVVDFGVALFDWVGVRCKAVLCYCAYLWRGRTQRAVNYHSD